MPRIDPSVACHQLTVNPSVSDVAQRHRKQSPEKAKAPEKAVMPFGLRNVGATYQRMMNKVYDKKLLDNILEVYMDDMVVKYPQEVGHAAHLKRVFEQTRKYNMRLNPEKCTFGV